MKTTASAVPAAPSRSADLVALAKPRLNMLVVVSAVAGYVMASGDTHDVWRLLFMVAGTGFVAGGASAFNQLLERREDALMQRTRLRPLPDGRLGTRDALVFGSILTVAGLALTTLLTPRVLPSASVASTSGYSNPVYVIPVTSALNGSRLTVLPTGLASVNVSPPRITRATCSSSAT